MQLCKPNNADSKTDRNISIVSGWNLIGHSAETAFDISTITFTNTSRDTVTWANAIAQKKLYGYLAYYDSSSAVASNRKYKYAATSGVDDNRLRKKTGYWLNARQEGTLTLPGVGGTLNTSTYTWNKLRFHNGTDELNVSDADSEGWITKPGDSVEEVIWYRGLVRGKPAWMQIPFHKTTISPWEGYFVWSNYDNITLIRQN